MRPRDRTPVLRYLYTLRPTPYLNRTLWTSITNIFYCNQWWRVKFTHRPLVGKFMLMGSSTFGVMAGFALWPCQARWQGRWLTSGFRVRRSSPHRSVAPSHDKFGMTPSDSRNAQGAGWGRHSGSQPVSGRRASSAASSVGSESWRSAQDGNVPWAGRPAGWGHCSWAQSESGARYTRGTRDHGSFFYVWPFVYLG